LSQEDRRAVLAVATGELNQERATLFADVRESPVSALEAKRAVLGEIEFGHYIVPAELTSEPSIFSAVRLRSPTYVTVPVLLEGRTLATFDFEKSNDGWDWGSTGCESSHTDRANARVEQALTTALGGTPDATLAVDVTGSSWLIAARGDQEVAGYVQPYAYGTFGDVSVQLPAAGTVLTSAEFRALLANMKPQH